jgi:hypothetical protein
MAKFIKLTDRKRGETFALNIESVEYMLPIPNNGGTMLVTVTHHTKYEVRECMDDILSYLDDIGMVGTIPSAKETSPIVEVTESENHSI